MAKFNPIHGTLSGRVGGSVYAFNKGGFYVRNYVKQVQPHTQAQLNAKANFITSQTYWNSLSDVQKSQWNTYATTLFSPMYYKDNVQYSGQQAAMSLYFNSLGANQMKRNCNLFNGSRTFLPIKNLITAGTTPPNYRLSGNIFDHSGNIVTLSLASSTLTSTGSSTHYLNLSMSETAPLTWLNAESGNLLGLLFYCSNGLNSTRTFYKRPLYFILGFTGIFLITSFTSVPSYHQFEVTFNSSTITTANYKAFPATGQKARISAFLIDSTGQKVFIGSTDIIVS
jgi:hypothetical protein